MPTLPDAAPLPAPGSSGGQHWLSDNRKVAFAMDIPDDKEPAGAGTALAAVAGQTSQPPGELPGGHAVDTMAAAIRTDEDSTASGSACSCCVSIDEATEQGEDGSYSA